MTHLTIAPVIIPLLAAVLLIGGAALGTLYKRSVSLLATLLLAGVDVALLGRVFDGTLLTYHLSNWPAPFGIVLVADRLSILMLLLTAAVGLFSLWYAMCGTDRRGRHFHALFQLQLMGLNGAFLTGDLFNLFVFFEVLLIASYGLLLFGGGPARSRAGLHYVVLNLIGSTLFLIGVGIIYAMTGTLNMADLARVVAQADPERLALLRSGAFLLLVVFGLKAAAVPVAFWLPGTYSAASAPVAALFAIMTKVGVYSILRVFMLVFGGAEGVIGQAAGNWLVAIGLATLLIGNGGAVALDRLRPQIGYLLIGSVGTLLTVLGLFTHESITGGLYYLVHSTLITAGLFLLADAIGEQRGAMEDRLHAGLPLAQPLALGSMFFIGAIAYAGLPPFSGFLGKLMVLDAAYTQPQSAWIWAVVLLTGLLATIALTRAGSTLFWKTVAGPAAGPAASPLTLLPVAALLASSVLLVLLARPLTEFTAATATQLADPQAYIQAVLGPHTGFRGVAQ